MRAKGRPAGSAGARTLPIANGARSARTTRRTVTRGATCRTITHGRGPTAGARTACSGSATTRPGCASRIALWNGRDPILKERLFGLTGPEGNHGEDVKESYFYLDATPTASYLQALYNYPLAAFPYDRLIEENARRDRTDPEFELADTGIFDGDRYFDVDVEYAKADPTTSSSGSASRTAGRRRPRSASCRRSGSGTPGHGVSTTASRRSPRSPGPGMTLRSSGSITTSWAPIG